MGLCYARDEVVWLVRHYDNPPLPRSATAIKIQNRNKVTEDLTDRQLPELLFHMEELRGKVKCMQFFFCLYRKLFLWYSVKLIISDFSSCEEV